jgi:hypothetical protein
MAGRFEFKAPRRCVACDTLGGQVLRISCGLVGPIRSFWLRTGESEWGLIGHAGALCLWKSKDPQMEQGLRAVLCGGGDLICILPEGKFTHHRRLDFLPMIVL